MLRYARQFLAGIVLLLFLLLFLGGEETALKLRPALLYLQFAPSLLKFIALGAGGMAVGWLLILALTLLTGRVYCSVLCPLGILQDGVGFLARLIRRQRPKFGYQRPHWPLRYGILLLTMISAILGSMSVLNLFEPYSLFGRVTQHIVKPGVVAVNNAIVDVLEKFRVYSLPIQPKMPIVSVTAAATLGAALLIVVMAALRGRLYCQTLCPVGTLLGMFSKFAAAQIRIDESACTSCKRCERACRAGCIDAAAKTVDMSRCVVCFDCVVQCPTTAIAYRFADKPAVSAPVDASKRKFLLGSAAAGAALLASIPLRFLTKPALAASAPAPVTPPGSGSRAQFAERCTACHLCVSACPTRVLRPAWLAYGLQGVMQPRMDYATGYCNYDCNVCGQVCPTGAILPLPLAEKQLTQIGQARLHEDRCVVYRRHEDCAACAEVCPTHAVYTVERNGVRYPVTNLEFCIGCGACEYVCPQRPKAIEIQGNSQHAAAKPPYAEDDHEAAAPSIRPPTEDFPF